MIDAGGQFSAGGRPVAAAAGPVLLPVRQPLVDLWTTAAFTRLRTEGVMEEVLDGRISWAFDIGRPGARGRRCIRVLTRSILDYLTGQPTVPAEDGGFPEVFGLVFPMRGATVRQVVVAQHLHCSSDHVAGLLRSGALREVGRRRKWRGCHASAAVDRASVFEFLQAGRIR